jgi:Xaa-Pro aminopeptidase
VVPAVLRNARRLAFAGLISMLFTRVFLFIRPGASTALIDSAAREVLEARGLGAAFGHGTGHGLGLDVHEEPRIGRPRPDAPPVPVEPGMVSTIEPGAYLPGWGGVRIEDDVLVTSTGCEVLTSVPRELLAL